MTMAAAWLGAEPEVPPPPPLESARPQVKASGILQNPEVPPPPPPPSSSPMTSRALAPVAPWPPLEGIVSQLPGDPFADSLAAALVTGAAGAATGVAWQAAQQVPPPPPPRSSTALVPVAPLPPQLPAASGGANGALPRSQLPAACVTETHPDQGHKSWSQRHWREILTCRCGVQLRSEWFFGGANKGWQKAHGWSASKKLCSQCL
jgi:hypothetical protein